MPTFTNTPPPNPRGHTLSLVRVIPAHALVGVITAEDLIGCHTHYWHGRTVPCETPNCKPCNEGQPFRWHAYVTFWDPTTAKHSLLELTAATATRLVEYRLAHGTLRGCYFKAQRANYAKNSRVLLDCKPADLAKINLPHEPNIPSILAIIWNIPDPAIKRTNDGGLGNAIETLSDVADTSRCLPVGQYAEALAHRLLNPSPGNGQ